MRFLLALLGLFLWIIPQQGMTQNLSLDNLSIHVGTEYSKMQWKDVEQSNPFNRPMNDFTVSPHVKLSYSLYSDSQFTLNIHSGYSKLNFKEHYSIPTATTVNQRISMHTLSVGAEGLFNIYNFQVGPMLSGYKLLDSDLRVNYTNGDYKYTGSMDDYLANESLELGLVLRRKIGSHFLISLEGLFGTMDIFSPDYYEGNLQHFRATIGYEF